MASVALVPRVQHDVKQALETLQSNFSLSEQIIKAILATGIQNLEEFRYLWDTEEGVERWVTKLSLGDQSLLMTARLRRAWAAAKVYYQQIEQDRSKVALADLDSMLEEGELRDAKTAFWLRYKMRFPAEVHPADAVVSRVARELSKRMLCVYNVWKVRSLQFQMGSSQKRRKVGEGLFTEEADHDEAFNMDVDTYLAKLQTLMIACALAGTAPLLTGVPDPKAENVLGANSTEFVEVPLDIAFAYLIRARKAAFSMPPNKRLPWIQARDAEERAEWVSKFREGTKSLGTVIRELMEARDAHWLPTQGFDPGVSHVTVPQPPNPPKGDKGGRTDAGQQQPSKFQLGPIVAGKQTAKCLKDGKMLCPAFQVGKCKEKACSKGLHRCAVVLRGERVCGSPSHHAAACKAKLKAN